METAILVLRKHEYTVKAGQTVRHALEQIGMDSDTVLAVRGKELITDDELVRPGEVIRLVNVISGGLAA